MPDELEPQDADLTLLDYMEVFRRRRAIIILTFGVVLAAAVVLTLMTKPLFRSATRILVEGADRRGQQVSASDPLSGLFTDTTVHGVTTQLQVIRSDEVVKAAFAAADVPRKAVVIKARQVEDTDVIEILVESGSRRWAEAIARQLPQTYLGYVSGSRNTDVVNALAFARAELDKGNLELLAAERALQVFRERRRIGPIEAQAVLRTNEASAVSTAVRQAEAAVAGAQARHAAMVAARAKLPKTLTTPTETTNPRIEITRTALAQLATERSKALILYKPTNVEVQKIDAQIADMERRLAALPATLIVAQRVPNPAILEYNDRVNEELASVDAARQQLSEARAQAGRSAVDLSNFGALELQHGQLQRKVDQTRERVQMLTKSVADLSLREKATHAPVLVVEPASAAEQLLPNVRLNLLVGAILGLAMGLGLALLQESRSDPVGTPEAARRIADAPTIGYLPLVAKPGGRAPIGADAGGALLESCRVLRSAVQFATVDMPVSSIMVTSTALSEGKSTVAANLAIAMALNAKRVILVDADLRRSTVHKSFQLDNSVGLTDVLIGTVPLEDAIQDTSTSGLRVLSAGSPPPNPAELLNSRAMQNLAESLMEKADVVIYDSPPCLPAADAQVLASQVDGVLFVTQLGHTRRSGMRRAMEMLYQARANLIGIVINKVDTSSVRDSYYGYYGQYAYTADHTQGGRADHRPPPLRWRRDRSDEDEITVPPTRGAIAGKSDDRHRQDREA